MIYVTHDQVEAMTMSDRMCIMNGGRVVQVGPPLEIYQNPADTFVASFLGNPPMNLIRSRIELGEAGPLARIGKAEILFREWPHESLKAHVDKPVIVGIRPEDISENGAEGFITLAAEVNIVEPLGAETILGLALEGVPEPVMARVGRQSRSQIGDRILVFMSAAAIQLFDPQSTRTIPQ
jgi:multiple sugar transport system ATP-binding protein